MAPIINTTSPQTATRILTNLEILALPTTAITVVPAPGAGKMIQIVSVNMVIRKAVVFGGVDADTDVWLKYDGGAVATVGPGTTNGHLVFDDGTDPKLIEQTINLAASGALADYENKAVQVTAVNDADYIEGDGVGNSLTVSVVFHTIGV